MQTMITLSSSSPKELEMIVRKLIQEPDPYTASEAVYSVENQDGSSLVFDGSIKDAPCMLRITECDSDTAPKILTALGFKAEHVVDSNEKGQTSKLLRKK